MATTLDKFVEDLKKFFKEAQIFLTDTIEGYSMNGEDDMARDKLVDTMEALMSQLRTLPGQSEDEIYDDTLVGEDNINDDIYDDNVVSPGDKPPSDDEEYLAPQVVRKAPPKKPVKVEEAGIMDETYEDAEMEEEYEDPDSAKQKNGGAGGADEGGIMEEEYEDPYADKHKEADNDSDAITEDVYEDTEQSQQTVSKPPEKKGKVKQSVKEKKDKKDKKEKEKKNKKEKERLASDTKSEGSNEDTSSISSLHRDIPASELINDADMQGHLQKHKEKNTKFRKMNRWCAVKDKVFYYYENKKSKKPKGSITLEDYEASEVAEEVQKKKYVFQLSCPGRKTYYFTTHKEEDMKHWVHYLNTGTVLDISTLPATPSPPPPGGDTQQQSNPQVVEPDDGELYEDTTLDNNAEEEVATLEDEELYEDPENIIRERITEDAPSDDEAPGPPPAPPARSDSFKKESQGGNRAAPPLPPTRGVNTSLSEPPVGRKALPLPNHTADAEEEVGEDDELYDDTEAPPPPLDLPPPPPIAAPEPAPLLRMKQETTARSAESLPPPPEELTNYEALYYGVWTCQNVTDEELEFARGDTIEILNKSKYDGQGWWVGKLGNKVGLVPKNYISPMYKEI